MGSMSPASGKSQPGTPFSLEVLAPREAYEMTLHEEQLGLLVSKDLPLRILGFTAVVGSDGAPALGEAGDGDEGDDGDDEDDDVGLSKTKLKKQNRLTVAELKQLVNKPAVVDVWVSCTRILA